MGGGCVRWQGPGAVALLLVVCAALLPVCLEASLEAFKYSTRLVRTKYGPLRGLLLQQPPVEAFLGVPYATPPTGALRYMPPVTPSMWRTPRLADAFSPVCPQRQPDISNRSEALLRLPRGRLAHLERLLPLLLNQSEDCLYLNIYVPRTGSPSDHQGAIPCLLYVHGESYEWNSGNPYDGSVLASHGHIIVVTINFRLGILGFLKTGSRGSAQGNFGLMDVVAGLHWLRENLPAFGGDPERITLMGHGTGAALANYIAVSPVAKELLHRVILLSGSGLSPWALQREPLAVKRRVAEQTGCHGDLVDDDLAPCLRGKSLAELLRVRLEPPRFLPGFAPFVDGAVLPVALGAGGAGGALALADLAQARHGGPGYELADFPERDLLFGLTTTESYLDLSAQDLEFGFDETRRDRILRTYVRNAYYFHLNEIFSTLKNEYTDWERPAGNPLGVRDATLEVLSDGHTTAPLLRVGYLHSVRGGRTYFMHFRHQSTQTDYPQRAGSVRGEDVPYVLGLPLVGGQPFFPHNYSTQDAALSTQLIHYLANFVRKGDPNGPASPRQGAPHSGPPHSGNLHAGSPRPSADPSSTSNHDSPFWDTYDSINQLYLEMGEKPEVRNHYRGHKMSLWLNLIPQLHQPGIAELSMRHHHFQEEGAQYYDGSVRPQSLQRPSLPTAATLTTSTETPTTTGAASTPAAAAAPASTTECPPNATAPLAPAADTVRPANSHNLLRKLANSHYQSYTTALTVTIAVGCFLLLLNILIFAGIYHQRDRAAAHSKHKKKKDEMMELNSCSSGSGDMELKQALADSQMSVSAAGGSTIVELPLQEFKSSPPPGGGGLKGAGGGDLPPGYCSGGDLLPVTSPSIPEPPPPPKAQPPNASILRQQHMAGCPQTPSSMKKRVQIQEISV